MDKKIGSIFFLIFLYVFSSYSDEITLQALDVNGQHLTQPMATIPFIFEACVTSQNSIPGTPQIAGLQNVTVEDKGHVSTINTIVNGIRSTKKIFQYRIVIDKPGFYTFGPALLINNKRRLQSNILNLEVVDEQKINKLSEPFIKLLVDKKDIVIGEPLEFKVRFYPIKSVNLEGLSEPKIKDFSATKLEGPYTGSEMIDGERISYIEWRSHIYPKKVGKLKIPPIAAVYKIQRKFRNHALEMFDRLFDGGLDKKQIYSNSLMIDVSNLPEHDEFVNAIGKFTRFSAQVDHTHAREGEGIVYSLVIEGEGDLNAIAPPELSMPKGLKYYESKSSVDQSKNRKIFEYIVQGIEGGNWIIPAQKFTFFDLTTRKYSSIKSNPIEVQIQTDSNLTNISTTTIQEESTIQQQSENLAINQDGPWYPQKERTMPWHIFLCISACFFVISLYRFYAAFLKNYRLKNRIYADKELAFVLARNALKKAENLQDKQALYPIFVQLFAHRLMVPLEQITQERIENHLQKTSLEPDILNRWREFFTTIVQIKFFESPYGQQEQIFNTAQQWLQILEKQI